VEIGNLREFYLKRSGLDADSRKLMTANTVFGKVVRKALPDLKTNQIKIKLLSKALKYHPFYPYSSNEFSVKNMHATL